MRKQTQPALWLTAPFFVAVAAHDRPVRKVKWIKELSALATGGWDNVVRFWDCRAPKPGAEVALPDRCYGMDARYPLLVVATAERKIGMFDLRKLGEMRAFSFILSLTIPL